MDRKESLLHARLIYTMHVRGIPIRSDNVLFAIRESFIYILKPDKL